MAKSHIFSVKVLSIYDIYTRSEQYTFHDTTASSSDAKLRQEYIHLEDSLRKHCENRTLLPGEQIAVKIEDIILTNDKKGFDDTNIYDLIKGQEEMSFENCQKEISLMIKYKKTKFVLPFAIPKIDTFKEKLIILDSIKE